MESLTGTENNENCYLIDALIIFMIQNTEIIIIFWNVFLIFNYWNRMINISTAIGTRWHVKFPINRVMDDGYIARSRMI